MNDDRIATGNDTRIELLLDQLEVLVSGPSMVIGSPGGSFILRSITSTAIITELRMMKDDKKNSCIIHHFPFIMFGGGIRPFQNREKDG